MIRNEGAYLKAQEAAIDSSSKSTMSSSSSTSSSGSSNGHTQKGADCYDEQPSCSPTAKTIQQHAHTMECIIRKIEEEYESIPPTSSCLATLSSESLACWCPESVTRTSTTTSTMIHKTGTLDSLRDEPWTVSDRRQSSSSWDLSTITNPFYESYICTEGSQNELVAITKCHLTLPIITSSQEDTLISRSPRCVSILTGTLTLVDNVVILDP